MVPTLPIILFRVNRISTKNFTTYFYDGGSLRPWLPLSFISSINTLKDIEDLTGLGETVVLYENFYEVRGDMVSRNRKNGNIKYFTISFVKFLVKSDYIYGYSQLSLLNSTVVYKFRHCPVRVVVCMCPKP